MNVATQPTNPARHDGSMSRDETIALLNGYYDAFNAGNKSGVLEAFDPACQFVDLTMGRTMHGLSELEGFIDDTWALSPYFRIEPEEIVIEADRVAVRLQMSGARKVDKKGRPKANYLWQIPSTTFFKIRNGKIVWKADSWNALAIPGQIGWFRVLPMLLSRRR